MTTPADHPEIADTLCKLCRVLGERGWCRATSGNFSARIDDAHFLITQSGRDKASLAAEDLMICELAGRAVDPNCTPSAEMPLHATLYALDANIGSVLHTHSVTATVLSRNAGSSLEIEGFEMQKALRGITTHEESVRVPVFENDQDMEALAERLADAYGEGRLAAPGFLIAGHGLYAWGADITEAKRHVEGFEFLFECLWQESLAKLP
jgi:methylthioribulose-1-phosphate dehydratase